MRTSEIDPVSAPADRQATRPVLPGRGAAALSGVVAAALGLGAGHLAAGTTAGAQSPVVAIGGRVIAAVPQPVKQFAIDTFGSADKIALVVGISALSLVLGAMLGLVARRRPVAAAAGLGLFALAGVLASLSAAGNPAVAAFPSVVAGAVAIAALLVLLRLARPTARRDPAASRRDPATGAATQSDRRRFLVGAGGGLALAAAFAGGGAALERGLRAAASTVGIRLPRPADPLPPVPPAVSVDVPGVAPFVTPNADFYRVDINLQVPRIRPQDWFLRVGGMVERPLQISYDDLLARPLVEADITLTCVSNVVGGGLVGNARWLGVPLRELLEEAGVRAGADQVIGRSIDDYTCGFPVAAALDGREALVAVGMNGEPLPVEHGFPARLIVPGLYGYVSATKWLTEIELSTFAAFDQYWVPRGWDERAPIKTMARIDTPQVLGRVPAGIVPVAGVAWAQTRGIERVELRVDDGPWQEAELADALGLDTWRQWVVRWEAVPGTHTLTVRATDGTGEVQTEDRAEPFPNGASGWQSLVVAVEEPQT